MHAWYLSWKIYIYIYVYIYTDSSVTVQPHKESEKIRIKRGVRQGDTISHKLFTATLESTFSSKVKLGEQGREDRPLQHQGKEPGQSYRYNEESWQAWWHTPNTGISSKATLPSAWRDKCTTPVCCQLWHIGAETWTLTKQAQKILAAAQTKMERGMLNITYKDRRPNIWVRERTKVIDIISNVRKKRLH